VKNILALVRSDFVAYNLLIDGKNGPINKLYATKLIHEGA
jgi:hypothetical protein